MSGQGKRADPGDSRHRTGALLAGGFISCCQRGLSRCTQHTELVALCERSGWAVVRAYRETVSGTKAVDRRPELRQLLLEARQRQFDKVVVWSANRLGRSMRHSLHGPLQSTVSDGSHLHQKERQRTDRRG